MPALTVKLPRNRDFCGEIRLIGDAGAALAGPYKIAGRAADAAAAAAGNAARSPLLRFGDTPAGRYTIGAILPSGAGTAYRQPDYGGAGIIVLDPRGGDAALAEANGRFQFFIQGGTAVDGRLGATNGALRMRDRDLVVLCRLLGEAEGVECWCVEDAALAGGEPVLDNGYDEGDPPPRVRQRSATRDVSRRRVLAGGAAIASSAMAPSLPVLLPGIFVAAAAPLSAQAQNAYDGNNSGNNQDNQDNNQDNTNQDQQNNPDNNDQNNNGDDNNTPKAY